MTRKAWNRYRVRCIVCGWTGYRFALECECYEDWAMYCRPNSPGPGCPAWVTYPCPKGHVKPDIGRDYMYQESDSAVVIVKPRESLALEL